MKFGQLTGKRLLHCWFIGIVLTLSQFATAQISTPDTTNLIPQRLRTVVWTESLGYGVTMAGLYQLWYADFEQSSFHFFNDNDQWLQMDKGGHMMTSYYVGKLGMDVLLWTGLDRRKSMWYGGGLGLAFLTTVEVFDGFSERWGASSGDMLANTAGTVLLFGQELLWQEQRVLLKFSYHHTDFAAYRPNTLGSSWNERILKDYNGQTYWASANLAAFFPNSSLPKWLNLAVGYGGDGMIGGSENPIFNDEGVRYPQFQRRRQLYTSLDVDLTRIKTGNKWLKTGLNAFGFIKVPFPALEWREGKGLFFHPIYF